MEKSSFFNSVNGDRRYKAEDFANYFSKFITNGVFPNVASNLQVIANGDMSITLKPGAAWINGYMYQNTDDLILPIDVADGVLNRIDRVVIQLNYAERLIKAVVKKGTFSSSPVAPSLQRDADIYELGIADIAVNKGVTSITQSAITDLRLNTTLCGMVNSLLQADTTAIFNQYQDWFERETTINEQEFDQFMADQQQAFQTWFDSVKGQLSGDVAGSLANRITEVETDLATHTADTTIHITAEERTAWNEAESNAKAYTDQQLASLKAKNIAVEDANNHFTGTDVESVLNELFTFANDGKTAVANAITAKGVSASPSDTFAALATKIGQISTGKKYAIGNTATDANNKVVVNNLSFRPKTVIVTKRKDASRKYMFFYSESIPEASMLSNYIIEWYFNGSSVVYTVRPTSTISIGEGTFTVDMSSYVGSGVFCDWIAYE